MNIEKNMNFNFKEYSSNFIRLLFIMRPQVLEIFFKTRINMKN
jgi:hypothetical protein